MVLQQHKQDWEELGRLHPLWSIATNKDNWDIKEFFVTGENEIQDDIERAMRLGYPRTRETVLDFGCGVGRLTRALSRYFTQCYGVDIAESMIANAKELNQFITGCTFIVNSEPHLRIFSDKSFDMIYSKIVLQHILNTQIIKSYIAEFVRVLKTDGLLVFQLPSYIPFYMRFLIRCKKGLYRLLRKVGISEQYLYERLKGYGWRLNPMHLSYLPERDIVAFLNAEGARVLEVRADDAVPPPLRSCTYYVTKQD